MVFVVIGMIFVIEDFSLFAVVSIICAVDIFVDTLFMKDTTKIIFYMLKILFYQIFYHCLLL